MFKKFVHLFIVITILLTITSCSDKTKTEDRRPLLSFKFSSTKKIYISTTIKSYTEADANHIWQSIKQQRDEHFKTWFSPQPNRGLLAQTNEALKKGYSMILEEEPLSYLRRLYELSLKSNHLFNPAMGSIYHLWAFKFQENAPNPILPNTKQLNSLVAQKATMQDLVFQTNSISSTNPTVNLYLTNSIEGHLLEKIKNNIDFSKIPESIIQTESAQLYLSHHSQPFFIEIYNPKYSKAIPLCSGEMLFRINRYNKAINNDNKIYHRFIDYRTGRPSKDKSLFVGVISNDALLAQVTAQSLLVSDDKWQSFIDKMSIKYAFIEDENNHFKTSEKLAARLSINKQELCQTTKI